MGKNFAYQMQYKINEAQEIAFRTGYQCACDLWSIAIAQVLGVGSGRMLKLSEAFDQLYKEYGKAWMSSDPEADWMQEQIDAELKRLYPDNFVTFYERNPFVRKTRYGKGKK